MKNLKLPLVIISLCVLPLFSNGQKKDSLSQDSLAHTYISVNGGPVFIDRRVPAGGTFNIFAQIPFHQSYFGFACMMEYGTIPFSLDQFIDNLSSQSNYYTYKGISKSNGTEFGVLAGIYASVPLHKFTFQINLLVGAFVCVSPGATYSYGVGTSYGFLGTITYHPDEVLALGADFSFSLRYRISKHICASLNLDILYLAPSFNTPEYIDYYGSTNYVLNGSAYHPSTAGMANTTLGIGYLLSK